MVLNPVACRASGILFDELRQILWRYAEFVGIEAYESLLAVVLLHKIHEAAHDVVFARRDAVIGLLEVADASIVEYANKVLDHLKAEWILGVGCRLV